MKTNKPLAALVKDMIDHIDAHKESHIDYNSSLINILNGNLKPYVEASMKEELNPRAFSRSRNRIPPINILNKLDTKLSKVYAEPARRTPSDDNTIDAELIEHYESGWNIDSQLQWANSLLVINKYCALEPYMNDGEPSLRVLSAKDFIVYSDSNVNPNEPTVFIKFMGNMSKQMPMDHRKIEQFKDVSLFYAYSEDEFIIFDDEGDVLEQLDNPYGKIPFVYIRTSPNELIPTPDSDNLPMVTLIPKLMADLNYAVMFGCRSQVVGIDIEMDNVEWSPDSLWILNSVQGDNKSPSLDTIKSDVDVDKVLNLINTQLGLWLDTKGIKTGSIGKATVDNAASGISKLIDESDASAVNRRYKEIFKNTEKKLWKLLPELHTVWVSNDESEVSTSFSSTFSPTIELSDLSVVPNNLDILNELKLEDELGLMDKKRALKRLNPDADDKEIEQLLEELNPSLRIEGPNPSKEESINSTLSAVNKASSDKKKNDDEEIERTLSKIQNK
jgi:hypothetical protein